MISLDGQIDHMKCVPCCGEGRPGDDKGAEDQSKQPFQRQNNAQRSEADHWQQAITQDTAGAPEVKPRRMNEVQNTLQGQAAKDTEPIYVAELNLMR